MAKSKAPFQLIYIVLCESVSEDNEGSLSLHGILGSRIIGSDSDHMPPVTFHTKAVVSFYIPEKRVTFSIRVTLQWPEGHETEGGTAEFGNVNGQFLPMRILAFDLTVRTPGVYWFKVYHGQELLGRYPLTIAHQRLEELPDVQ